MLMQNISNRKKKVSWNRTGNSLPPGENPGSVEEAVTHWPFDYKPNLVWVVTRHRLEGEKKKNTVASVW